MSVAVRVGGLGPGEAREARERLEGFVRALPGGGKGVIRLSDASGP